MGASAAPARRDENRCDDRLMNRFPVLDALGHPSIEQHTQDVLARMRSVVVEMRTDFALPVLDVDTNEGYEPDLDVIIDVITRGTDAVCP